MLENEILHFSDTRTHARTQTCRYTHTHTHLSVVGAVQVVGHGRIFCCQSINLQRMKKRILIIQSISKTCILKIITIIIIICLLLASIYVI